MRLSNRSALITGGGMGIGRSIAQRFAQEGASVVVADLNQSAGEETVKSILSTGGTAIFLQADVSKAEDAQRMVSTALTSYGSLHILVNSAGVYARGDVVSTTEEIWNRLIRINLTGVFLCCRAAIPHMRQAGAGAIINISSSVGWHDTAPGIAAYTASKFGVTGLTKAMACDHLHENIRVNCICPGPTDTPLLRSSRSPDALQAFTEAQPIGRLGSPQEIAAAALFLASEEASFVTGVALPVDGGQTAHIQAIDAPTRTPTVELLSSHPPEWPQTDLRSVIRQKTMASQCRVVVLDDDPTGTQTVHGLPVVTDWTVPTLTQAQRDSETTFYTLTNSRRYLTEEAADLNRESAANLAQVSSSLGAEPIVVGRSASTLRCHFPQEVDALRQALETALAITCDGLSLGPFFLEGGRLTVHDVHCVQEGDWMTPAGQTEFA